MEAATRMPHYITMTIYSQKKSLLSEPCMNHGENMIQVVLRDTHHDRSKTKLLNKIWPNGMFLWKNEKLLCCDDLKHDMNYRCKTRLLNKDWPNGMC
jgi:hypothetical protein